MRECVHCRDSTEHPRSYGMIRGLPASMLIHEYETCPYYLCRELGDDCPNCKELMQMTEEQKNDLGKQMLIGRLASNILNFEKLLESFEKQGWGLLKGSGVRIVYGVPYDKRAKDEGDLKPTFGVQHRYREREQILFLDPLPADFPEGTPQDVLDSNEELQSLFAANLFKLLREQIELEKQWIAKLTGLANVGTTAVLSTRRLGK